MEYRKYGDKIYLRLDKNDEIIGSLQELCRKEAIRTASFEGIGGCDAVEVGIFDPVQRNYITHARQGMLEMASLSGNMTVYEDKPFIHAHAVFAFHDNQNQAQTLSGHLLSARIGLTAEIVVTPAEACITRRYINELGIRIWNFD